MHKPRFISLIQDTPANGLIKCISIMRQVFIDSRTPDLFWHFSEEDESHFGSAYFSPVCAQMRNLGPFWSSLRGLSPLLFLGPLSAQAVWEEICVWHRLNKHQPGSALWWEPWKDPTCRKKSEQLSKHCRRCDSRLHHTMSLLSLFGLPKMLLIPIRLWLFQLPLFAAFFMLTSNPTLLFSATSYYAPASSWKLNITASFFFLLHTLSFFPFASCNSMDVKSFRGYDVIWGIILWVDIYKHMSWGGAVCGYSRTGVRKLLSLRCEIISIKTNPCKNYLERWTLVCRAEPQTCKMPRDKDIPAFTLKSRSVHTLGHHKLPPHSINAASAMYFWHLESKLTYFLSNPQAWCHPCPKSCKNKWIASSPKCGWVMGKRESSVCFYLLWGQVPEG